MIIFKPLNRIISCISVQSHSEAIEISQYLYINTKVITTSTIVKSSKLPPPTRSFCHLHQKGKKQVNKNQNFLPHSQNNFVNVRALVVEGGKDKKVSATTDFTVERHGMFHYDSLGLKHRSLRQLQLMSSELFLQMLPTNCLWKHINIYNACECIL